MDFYDDKFTNISFQKDCNQMLNTSQIYENQFFNPQKNLSGAIKKKNPESEFALKFAQSYAERFSKIHSGSNKTNTLFIREVSISGNGIADLLVFSWNQKRTYEDYMDLDLNQLNPTIRAFEFKMSDWRKGMMQAHRYKFFSNASNLVLPKQKLSPAVSHLDVFRKLRVGFWGFDDNTRSITCIYTPRPMQQQIPKYGNQAIKIATQVVCS